MSRVVLVVEDDERSRRLLVDVLGHHGFEIIAAESGEAALELIPIRRPDAALLDIQLPGMDGFALLDRIRGLSIQPFPIVAVTASVMDLDRRRILSAGFDAFVSKPVDLRNLRTVLDELIPMKP